MNLPENNYEKLLAIMAMLRAPGGCPWDQEQDHKSLSRHALEEVYEVIETIDDENWEELPGELGDLLLQVVFHAQIAKEDGRFDMDDVLQKINDKLVRRHPHVFGNEKIESAAEQVQAWEKTKMQREGKKSAIDGVPRLLPALLRAHRLQGKAAAVGFDWEYIDEVWDKVHEEVDELKEAQQNNDSAHIQEELGDLLFAIVNLSRFLKSEPEEALRKACDKFERRFKQVEETIKTRQQSMSEMPLAELDQIWDDVKTKERQ